MTVLTARQIQAQNTKQHILNTASNLLKEKTLDEISIKEICITSKVSVGAFYHHFESKEAIIMELYKGVDDYFETEVITNLMDEDPIEAILDYLTSQCKYALDMGLDLVQNTYKAQMNNASSFFLSNERGLPNGLKILIMRAKELGVIRDDLSVDTITNELLIISRGVIYHWCVSNGSSHMLDNIKSIATSYLKSLAVSM